jgi:hypothetical protein
MIIHIVKRKLKDGTNQLIWILRRQQTVQRTIKMLGVWRTSVKEELSTFNFYRKEHSS